MPRRKLFFYALIVPLLAFVLTGCEPFENAERLFPLPANVWDRAVPLSDAKVFEIKLYSEQEFINLKMLLLTQGYQQQNRDFHFSAKKNGKLFSVKSSDGILLIGKQFKDSSLYPAAFYFERKNTLYLGIGEREK